MEAILRAARIGAFAGLAITAGALTTGSEWLIEPLWKTDEDKRGKMDEKLERKMSDIALLDLKELDLNELKQRYQHSLQNHLKGK